MNDDEILLEKLRNAKSIADLKMTEQDLIKCFYEKLQELINFRQNTSVDNGLVKAQNEKTTKQIKFCVTETKTELNDNSKKKKSFQSNRVIQKNVQSNSNRSNKKDLKLQISQLEKENQRLVDQLHDQDQLAERKINHLQRKIDRRDFIIKQIQIDENDDADIETIHNQSIYNKTFNEQQNIRISYCRVLSNISNQLIDSTSELYQNITGSQSTSSQIRPLILSIIFTKRWLILMKKKLDFDQSSLLIFTSRQTISIQDKIETIQNQFKEITEELSNTKMQMARIIENNKITLEKLNCAERKLFANENQLKILQQQTNYYKNEMIKMDDQMSTYISAAKFEKLSKDYSLLKDENESQRKTISQLRQIIEDQKKVIKESKRKCKSGEIQHEIDTVKTKNDQKQISNQQGEIDALKLKLKNRTKDLLAYERFASQNLSRQIMLDSDSYQNDDKNNQPEFTKSNINPKFLNETKNES